MDVDITALEECSLIAVLVHDVTDTLPNLLCTVEHQVFMPTLPSIQSSQVLVFICRQELC